jgi:hypothetical protein
VLRRAPELADAVHGIAPDDRELIIVFLKRYVSWCGKAGGR